MQSFMTLTGIDATSTNRTGFWIRMSKLCHKVAWRFFSFPLFDKYTLQKIRQKKDVSF